MSYQENRIFTLNEPNAPRLNPALACEIGLNESLLLLQIEFYISVSGIEKDGQKWIFNSTRDIRDKWFPFWSHHTINRAIKSLEKENYIITTTKYNEKKYDKTRWFSLNFEGLNSLESIMVHGHATGSVQNETGSVQNATGSVQNETTIQETKKENLKRDDVQAPIPPDPAPVTQQPSPPSLNSKDKENAIIQTLASLFSLIPEQHLKPSVRKTIEKALILHSEDYVKSAIEYTNDKSNGHSWQKYRAYLDKTLNYGYAVGYESEGQQIDQETRDRFKQMPDKALKQLGDAGNQIALEELDRRKK